MTSSVRREDGLLWPGDSHRRAYDGHYANTEGQQRYVSCDCGWGRHAENHEAAERLYAAHASASQQEGRCRMSGACATGPVETDLRRPPRLGR